KTYGSKQALADVSMTIAAGEMVALIGASGSGKSTLLRHIAGLSRADRTPPSLIAVVGRPVQNNGQLAGNIRCVRESVAFIFQQFNLVGRLPLLTNVLIGLLSRVPSWRSVLRQFTEDEIRLGLAALSRVGVLDHALQRASTLSGGQQQRAAIARAMVQKAKVILADEPIASLDPRAARRVMDMLAAINREDEVTVLVSLHQVDLALAYCSRTIALACGRVIFDGPSTALTTDALRRLYGADADELIGRDVQGEPFSTLRPGCKLAAGVVS